VRSTVAFLCVSSLCSPALALPRDTVVAPAPTNAVDATEPPAGSEPDTSDDDARRQHRFTYVIGILEVLIPDLRLETPARISDGVDSVAISFPVHLAGLRTLNWPWSAGGSVFIEPAIPASQKAVRGLAGLRVFGAVSVAALALEGGAIGATDGSGAFVGGGPALGGPGAAVLVLVGRRYFVSGEDRWDFTLDFVVFDMTLLGAFSMDDGLSR
jgi:hypothetical protein